MKITTNNWQIRITVLLLFILTFGIAGQISLAKNNEKLDKKRIERLFNSLRCPISKAKTIETSSSETAEQMRSEVIELVREGKTDEEIMEYFRQNYSKTVILEPNYYEYNFLLWIIPGGLIMGMIGMIIKTIIDQKHFR